MFEIVGGAALIVGLATRVVAALFVVQLIGALVYVKQDLGILSSQPMPGAELDLAYLAGLVTLVLLGPGLLSVDERVGRNGGPRSARRHRSARPPRGDGSPVAGRARRVRSMVAGIEVAIVG